MMTLSTDSALYLSERENGTVNKALKVEEKTNKTNSFSGFKAVENQILTLKYEEATVSTYTRHCNIQDKSHLKREKEK